MKSMNDYCAHLTYKGRAAISSAGILAHLTTGTNLARVKLEPVPGALPLVVESHLQVGIAPVWLDERQ